MKIWLTQRVSALILAIYSLLMPIYVLAHAPLSAHGWQQLFTSGAMRLATLAFVLALVVHAWTGVRDILLDYIKSRHVYWILHAVAVFWLVTCVVAMVRILWQ